MNPKEGRVRDDPFGGYGKKMFDFPVPFIFNLILEMFSIFFCLRFRTMLIQSHEYPVLIQ